MKWNKDNNRSSWYISEDGRFIAHSSWDRSYGNHWVLFDNKLYHELMENNDEVAYQKAQHHCSTLKECKAFVETIR